MSVSFSAEASTKTVKNPKIVLKAVKKEAETVKLTWTLKGGAKGPFTVYGAKDSKNLKWITVKRGISKKTIKITKLNKSTKLQGNKRYYFYVKGKNVKSARVSVIVGKKKLNATNNMSQCENEAKELFSDVLENENNSFSKEEVKIAEETVKSVSEAKTEEEVRDAYSEALVSMVKATPSKDDDALLTSNIKSASTDSLQLRLAKTIAYGKIDSAAQKEKEGVTDQEKIAEIDAAAENLKNAISELTAVGEVKTAQDAAVNAVEITGEKYDAKKAVENSMSNPATANEKAVAETAKKAINNASTLEAVTAAQNNGVKSVKQETAKEVIIKDLEGSYPNAVVTDSNTGVKSINYSNLPGGGENPKTGVAKAVDDAMTTIAGTNVNDLNSVLTTKRIAVNKEIAYEKIDSAANEEKGNAVGDPDKMTAIIEAQKAQKALVEKASTLDQVKTTTEKGINEVGLAAKKYDAKKDIDDYANTLKSGLSTSDPLQKLKRNDIDSKAKIAKDNIDNATTEAAINTAKSDGRTAMLNEKNATKNGPTLTKSNGTITYYTTLNDAISAAEKGDTVTLNGDYTGNVCYPSLDELPEAPAGLTKKNVAYGISKGITLDLNGHKINGIVSPGKIPSGQTLTIKSSAANGVITTIDDEPAEGKCTGKVSIDLQNLTLNGGYICQGSHEYTITHDGDGKYTLRKETGTFSTDAGGVYVEGITSNNRTTIKTYTSLPTAIQNAQNGNTVKLNKDYDGDVCYPAADELPEAPAGLTKKNVAYGISKGITLDLNGHKINGTVSPGKIPSGQTLTIKSSAANGVIAGIDDEPGAGKCTGKVSVDLQNLTFNGGWICQGSHDYTIINKGNNAKCTLNKETGRFTIATDNLCN